MNEREFAEKIKSLGGAAYIAGGWVRDTVRKEAAKDKDYVIAGLAQEAFQSAFPDAVCVGKSFPVYLLEIERGKSEVALARKEEKCGNGYRGFRVYHAPEVTIEEDLYRRDTTMNSMAYSILEEKIIDPYGGGDDIRRGVIRATSAHFTEDPVRALRAARQAAQTGFVVSADTIRLMAQCREELACEPKERIVGELGKALAADKPAAFFRALQEAGLLETTFPELFALIGKTQPPEYHPEGDAFAHSLLVLEKTAVLSARPEVRFAALLHDIGKGLTPQKELPRHLDHEKTGLGVLRLMEERLRLPKLWVTCAAFAIREHMRAAVMRKPAKIVRFLLALEKNPLGFDGFSAIVRADHGCLPESLQDYVRRLAAIRRIKGDEAPAGLAGRQIGEWIRQKQAEAYCRLQKNKP